MPVQNWMHVHSYKTTLTNLESHIIMNAKLLCGPYTIANCLIINALKGA